MGYSSVIDVFRKTKKGRIVLVSWGGILVACSLYGITRTKGQKKRKNEKKAKKKSFTKLVKEGSRTSTWIKAASVVASLSLRSVFTSHMNDEIGILGEFAVKGNWDGVFQECINYSIWGFASAILQAMSEYNKDALAVDIRLNLSDELQAKLEEINLVSLKNSSETQVSWARILCHDVSQFADKTSLLFFSLVKPMIEVSWYTYKLANRIGKTQLAMCFSYFILTHCWTKFALPSKKELNFRLELAEDDFLEEHNRVCLSCEEIEFLRGRQFEIMRLEESTEKLSRARFALRLQHFFSDMFGTYFQKYGGVLVCFLSMVPSLRATDKPTEIFLQTLHDLVNMGLGFRDGFVALKSLESIQVLAERISDLQEQISEAQIDERMWRGEAAIRAKPDITTQSLEIVSPTDQSLLTCDFEILAGEKVLILGENGIGKSSLFRVLAGLWKRKDGKFSLPQDAYFLPQKPYLVQNLTVRAQLQYPSLALNPDDLELAMEVMDFKNLICPNLDEVLDWRNLSPGQKQIVALTRVIAHAPSALFLDEPNSALNDSVTERFFKWTSTQKITMVTISHDSALREYHGRVLEVKDKKLGDTSI